MTLFKDVLGLVGYAVEIMGVLAIVIGFVMSAIWFVGRLHRTERLAAFVHFRRNLARSLLLGLEFLIAGDIIRTVTVAQTLQGAAVLALIVTIRIALGVMLEIEIGGEWPWRKGKSND